MLSLDHAYKKSIITDSLTMQNILILLCLCIIGQTYSIKSGSLWNYWRDEMNDAANENNDANNYRINSNKTITSKCFEYQTKITEKTPNDKRRSCCSVKIFEQFLEILDLPLINCEIEINLRWTKNCIIFEISKTIPVTGDPNSNPPVQTVEATKKKGVKFQMINAKLYVPVFTLPINDNINFFIENLKQGFKRSISCTNNTTPKQQFRLSD